MDNFENYSNSNFHKIRPGGAELFDADGETDGPRNMKTRLI